jgi:hypothetical protein
MTTENNFLPVFSLDWSGLLSKLRNIEGDYGILAPISCHKKLLMSIKELNKPFFIDSGIFNKQTIPWYYQKKSQFINNRWVSKLSLASEGYLRHHIKQYLEYCELFSPDFVFAQDIFEEPLLSLYLARLAWDEYCQKERSFTLIGVVQTGYHIYNWRESMVPLLDSFPPHYNSPKSFLVSLISAYRDIGYKYIGLGGLLKIDKTRNTGFKFALSTQELDELLTWSRPEFVLGGLALTRVEVLKKHNVWADSTGWLWWDERYDKRRFTKYNPFEEVLGLTTRSNNTFERCDTNQFS